MVSVLQGPSVNQDKDAVIMKRVIGGLLLSLLALTPLSARDWSKVYRDVVERNVVKVLIDDGECTGVVIDQSRILSAAHCFSDTKSVQIVTSAFYPNIYVQAKILKVDTYVDLALLKAPLANKFAIHLAMENPIPGSEVAAIGFHSSPIALIIPTTIMTTPVSMGKGNTEMLALSSPLEHGQSGGPLVNGDEELVGINSMSSRQRGFDVPIMTIKAFLAGE